MLYSDSAFAGINLDRFFVFNEFQKELKVVIERIINDDLSVVAQLSNIVVRALYFTLLFYAVVKFIYEGFSEKIITYLFMGFVLGILTESYMIWTNGIFDFFEISALGIQEIAVGTDSRFYLSTYTSALFDRIELMPMSILDSLEYALIFLITYLVNLIFQVVVIVTEMYAVFGYAVFQIVGPVFLPFIIHPATRSIFDKWLSLLIGMAVYAFFVRVVSVVYSLFTMALVGAFTSDEMRLKPMMLDPQTDFDVIFLLVINSILGIVFLLGVGKTTSAITGGIGADGLTNKMVSGGAGFAHKMALHIKNR